jgi:hypothetical protein
MTLSSNLCPPPNPCRRPGGGLVRQYCGPSPLEFTMVLCDGLGEYLGAVEGFKSARGLLGGAELYKAKVPLQLDLCDTTQSGLLNRQDGSI